MVVASRKPSLPPQKCAQPCACLHIAFVDFGPVDIMVASEGMNLYCDL
jgi:hypothetical protein